MRRFDSSVARRIGLDALSHFGDLVCPWSKPLINRRGGVIKRGELLAFTQIISTKILIVLENCSSGFRHCRVFAPSFNPSVASELQCFANA